jgi:hypothetical protein
LQEVLKGLAKGCRIDVKSLLLKGSGDVESEAVTNAIVVSLQYYPALRLRLACKKDGADHRGENTFHVDPFSKK